MTVTRLATKPVLAAALVLTALGLSACQSFSFSRGGSTELEPLPPELQGRVIASSSTDSQQRMAERGINQTSFNPGRVEPNLEPNVQPVAEACVTINPDGTENRDNC